MLFAIVSDRSPLSLYPFIPHPMRALTLFFLLFLGWGAQAGAEEVERNGTKYSIFTFTPKNVELYWADNAGVPLRQFATVQRFIEARSRKVRFMMNGGIFENGGIPSGLLVIDGKVLRPINTADAPGNFYLKPNGVFYIDGRGSFVVSTDDFVSSSPKPRLAIQSGPLLLHSGKTHPAFRAESKNYLHRNGVGVRKDGSVLFAITHFGQARYPNLFEFADFFRSQGCADALFLDGDISDVVVDPEAPIPPGNFFGTVFAVTEAASAKD